MFAAIISFGHSERSEESRATIAGGQPDGFFASPLMKTAQVCHPERSAVSRGILLAGNALLNPSLRSG
jgi:hypothetical protein